MGENIIIWHSYPENEPPKTGYYIVTVKDSKNRTWLEIDYWDLYDPDDILLEGYWEKHSDVDYDQKIVAFSGLIKPYKEGGE